MTERELRETKLAFAIRRESELAGKLISWQEAVRQAREQLAEPGEGGCDLHKV
jgi:hypothetical protein